MDNSYILEVYRYHGMLNIEQGVNLWHLLNQTMLMGIEGEVVELGCQKEQFC